MKEKVIKFLQNEFPNGIQIFYTPNIVGDEMERIFLNGKVEILYAIEYDYVEIFGMEKDDYNEVVDKCSGNRWSDYMEV